MSGFTPTAIDGIKFIQFINDGQSFNIYLSDEENTLYIAFTYTLDGENLTINLPTGVEKQLKFAEDGDSYTINGVKVYKTSY